MPKAAKAVSSSRSRVEKNSSDINIIETKQKQCVTHIPNVPIKYSNLIYDRDIIKNY